MGWMIFSCFSTGLSDFWSSGRNPCTPRKKRGETAIKFEKKVLLILFCPAVACTLCAGGVLFWYIHAHSGALIPRWISVPIFCLFILTILLPSFFLRRAARKQA